MYGDMHSAQHTTPERREGTDGLRSSPAKMNWSRLHSSGNENVFKGSQLVSSILERHPDRFKSRAAALRFSRQLFEDGIIRGVFGADRFEDSVQLYTWNDRNGTSMTSYSPVKTRPGYGFTSPPDRRDPRSSDQKVVDDVRTKFTHRKGGHQPSTNEFLKPLEPHGFPEEIHTKPHDKHHTYHHNWNLQRASTASSESSVDALPQTYSKLKERVQHKAAFPVTMTMSRDHEAIPEEATDVHVMEVGTGTNSIDYDGSSSIPRSTGTNDTSQQLQDELEPAQRPWAENQFPYSDNEKQLIEQMKRMKKEHSHILRTYEDRINKLMAKMHELRSIAEMLENSSTKSSPYGVMPAKAGLLNLLGSKLDPDRKPPITASSGDSEHPPPLPPRPGRGNRLYPNKPIVQTQTSMKQLAWTRVILRDEGKEETSPTVWHTMLEPKLDPEEIERLFSNPAISQTDGATLYDDLIIRRGRSRHQLVGVFDSERSKRLLVCMRCLRATLTDVISSVSTLDTSQVNQDSLAELIENLGSGKEIDKILYHVRKKGAGQLDHPEYLVFELSKVDHFRDRLEFFRFRYKMQWHLFEIDQQLRELHTACDEITNSTPLKNLLETLLSVGNYLNGGTEMGQADGFGLDVLNKLKDLQDRDGKGTLLEFVLKTYCQLYESEVDIGCPTRFRLPEPSNMRHASQVSFEGIQDALTNLYADLRNVREKLLDPTVNKDTMRPMDSFRVTAENFFSAALEVIGEQEKVLQNTRDFFVKTVNYFVLDDNDISPQQFFHVWAVFLHDCKYFWKLAHRRLAKERFELEFKYKGQLSLCSLHGYGSFQAGVLRGMTSNRPSHEEQTSAATQLKQINNWMESIADSRPDVAAKPVVPHKTEDARSDHSQRSASPKPLTSTPPTSNDVHKPKPKSPVMAVNGMTVAPTRTTQASDLTPNYENQSEYDRLVKRQSDTSGSMQPLASVPEPSVRPPAVPTPENGSRKSQQFSLKTWLKREREQVRRGVENDVAPQPQLETKHQSPSRSFSKLKNSMMARFTGGSSSRKAQEGNSRPTEAPKPPPKPERLDKSARHDQDAAYDVLRNNYPNYASPYRVEENQPAQPVRPDGYMKARGSGQSDLESTVPTLSPQSPYSPYGIVDVSRMSQFQEAPAQQDVSVVISSPKNDFNNNEKFCAGNRAPAVTQVGNVDFSGVTSNGVPAHELGRTPRTEPFSSPPYQQTRNNSLLGSADSKRVRAQAVPVYKAKIINNYENQGKFESTNAIRQKAEPVWSRREPPEQHTRGGSAGRRMDTVDNYSSPYSRVDQTYRKEVHDTPTKSSVHSDNDSQFQMSPEGYRSSAGPRNDEQRRYHGDSTNDNSSYGHRDARLDNHKYLTPGNRAPMNAQSITSLIDRFDKQNNNEHSPMTSGSARPPVDKETVSAKPLTMTSTPVAPRRGFGSHESPEVSPPLPPRSGSDRDKSDNVLSPIDNVHSSDRYRAPEVVSSTPSRSQNYNSPYGKYTSPANQTSMQTSYGSPSIYTTPSSKLNSPAASYQSPQASNRYQYNENDRDQGYSAQLRRAANHASAFDRYAKHGQYNPRGSNSSSVQTSASTAVVKPTVMPQEGFSYMAL